MFEKNKFYLLTAVLMAMSLAGTANAQNDLAAEPNAFKPFLGKIWKGELKSAGQEKPSYDVARGAAGQGIFFLIQHRAIVLDRKKIPAE